MIRLADLKALPAKLDDLSEAAFLEEYGDAIIPNPSTGQGIRLRDLPSHGHDGTFQSLYQKWRKHKESKNMQTVVSEVSRAEGIPPREAKGLLSTILGDWAEDPRKKKWLMGVMTALGIAGATALGVAYSKGRGKDKAMEELQKQVDRATPAGGSVKKVMDEALNKAVDLAQNVRKDTSSGLFKDVADSGPALLPKNIDADILEMAQGVTPFAEKAVGLPGKAKDILDSIPEAPGEKVVDFAQKLRERVPYDMIAPTVPKVDVPSGWGQAIKTIHEDMGGFNPLSKKASIRVAMRYMMKKK